MHAHIAGADRAAEEAEAEEAQFEEDFARASRGVYCRDREAADLLDGTPTSPTRHASVDAAAALAAEEAAAQRGDGDASQRRRGARWRQQRGGGMSGAPSQGGLSQSEGTSADADDAMQLAGPKGGCWRSWAGLLMGRIATRAAQCSGAR